MTSKENNIVLTEEIFINKLKNLEKEGYKMIDIHLPIHEEGLNYFGAAFALNNKFFKLMITSSFAKCRTYECNEKKTFVKKKTPREISDAEIIKYGFDKYGYDYDELNKSSGWVSREYRETMYDMYDIDFELFMHNVLDKKSQKYCLVKD
jgi:hypothetical protein